MRVIKVDVRRASIYYKLIIDLLLGYFNTTVGVCACTRVCLPVSERTTYESQCFHLSFMSWGTKSGCEHGGKAPLPAEPSRWHQKQFLMAL